jgi:hypothetical protein
MVVRGAYIRLYRIFSKGIFHRTMEEIDVEGIAFYNHQREIVPTRVRSKFCTDVYMMTRFQ